MTRRTLVVATAIAVFLVLPAVGAGGQGLQPPPPAPGTVTLPLAEYDRLAERAARPPAPAPVAPVAAVLHRADLTLRASATDLRGSITLRGEVLRGGSQKVPLFAGGTLIDARQEGNAAPVLRESELASAILQGPGPFTLVLSWAIEVASQAGRATATLPAIRCGSVELRLEVPGETSDVRVDPGLVVSRAASAGKTLVTVTLPPGAPSVASWASRDRGAAPSRDERFTSDVRTLIALGEADTRMASLFDVSVLEGQPARFVVRLPDGFEVASVSGVGVETEAQEPGRIAVAVRTPATRRHQFLIVLERAEAAGLHAEFALPSLEGGLRETGEVAWEGQGTVELTACDPTAMTGRCPPFCGALRRLDVSEVSAPLRSLSRSPLLAAFRYQRRDAAPVGVAFEARRFPDAPVAGALAERAVVTTLLTGEGRALTEFTMTLRNRGQLFAKVGLPEGATLVSAEVGGEPVKPVEGSDGARVPLVRPGFNPSGPYQVAFVYVTTGSALGKKGDAALVAASVDVPIALVEWEVFLPDRYEVRRFQGDLIPRELMPAAYAAGGHGGYGGGTAPGVAGGVEGGIAGGVVGGVVGGLPGAPPSQDAISAVGDPPGAQARARGTGEQQGSAPSQNVLSLQRRVSGVLPVRMDIPRAGRSYLFVRPLVLDEESTLGFAYRRR